MKSKQVELQHVIADTSLQVRKEINGWFVSKLVQVLKSGNKFHDDIMVLPDMRIISGFTRYEAYKKVLEPTDKITIRIYPAKNDRDAYCKAVEENINHGQPLQEFEKKAIRRNLQNQGWQDEKISKFLGISLDRFNHWDAKQVIVSIGEGKKAKQEKRDVKPGVYLPGKITEEQYKSHVDHHAISVVFHARQIIGRLKDGTVDLDEQTMAVLSDLHELLATYVTQETV